MKKANKNNEEEIVIYFKTELSEDLQYITLESIKFFAKLKKFVWPNYTEEIEKQLYWIELLERYEKED